MPWPSSPVAIAMKKLRKMVALSAAFLTRSGETTYSLDMSKRRVWTEYIPNRDELIRDTGNEFSVSPVMPWAAIWPMNTGSNAVAGGIKVQTLPSGLIHLYVACQPLVTIAEWNDRRDEAIAFLDQWVADVMDLSGADDATSDDGMGHLTITRAESVVIDHVPFKDRQTVSDFYYQSFSLKYGDEA